MVRERLMDCLGRLGQVASEDGVEEFVESAEKRGDGDRAEVVLAVRALRDLLGGSVGSLRGRGSERDCDRFFGSSSCERSGDFKGSFGCEGIWRTC